MKVKEAFLKRQKSNKRMNTVRAPTIKHSLQEKLSGMQKSTVGLTALKRVEGTSLNRCRICVRNLPKNIKKTDIFNLFKDYGPIKEILIKEEQHMLVITLSNSSSAERAVTYLNGLEYEDTVLMVRSFRIPAIKVYNLNKHVTNELLYMAFSIFGNVEECYVIIDQNGHCSGEGVVEYENKQAMYAAIKFCRDNSFFLTSSNVPVISEQYDPVGHYDGKPETLVTFQFVTFTTESISIFSFFCFR